MTHRRPTIQSNTPGVGNQLLKPTGEAHWDYYMATGRTQVLGTGFKELFGYDIAKELTDSLFWESHLHPDEKEHVLNELEAVLADGSIIHYALEYRFMKADNTYAYVRDRFVIIREGNRAVRMTGSMQDIGDLAQERRIHQGEQEELIRELTQNNIDLRQFSYITSHNLRGPVASLQGLCALLDHFNIENPSLREVLDGVKKAVNMFDDTIKDLSTVLNIKDRRSIPRQVLFFQPVYEKSLAQSEVLIDYCGAQINADFSMAPNVNYNKAYLESIFSNLLTNAIKYRSQERRLRISISTAIEDDHVVMKFSDNGLGIDLAANREKIFGLYRRFHEHAEGKGLGLFLIKSQLEALEGSIDIESTVDEGTTFILRFRR